MTATTLETKCVSLELMQSRSNLYDFIVIAFNANIAATAGDGLDLLLIF
jgi:hypothetical protein